MTWIKQMPDGHIERAPTVDGMVDGELFRLDAEGGQGVDGWTWVEDPVVAVTIIPTAALDQLAVDVEAAVTTEEYGLAVEQFIASVDQP